MAPSTKVANLTRDSRNDPRCRPIRNKVSKIDGGTRLDLRLTTRFGRKEISFTERTIVNTFMARQAVVAAFVQTALDAEEFTGSALRPAKLDTGS